MQGDDELFAVLAEMGATYNDSSSSPPKEAQKNKSQQIRPEDPPLDPRLTEDPQQWPSALPYSLGPSLRPGVCPQGWTNKTIERQEEEEYDGDGLCQICGLGRTNHNLVPTSSDLLPKLFCATRNLRCLVAEEEHNDRKSTMKTLCQEIRDLLNHKKLAKTLPATDLLAIREKAQDILLQAGHNKEENTQEWQIEMTMKADRLYYRIYYASLTDYHPKDNDASTVQVPHPPTYFSCPGLAWNVQKGRNAAKKFVQSLDAECQKLLTKTFALFLDEKSDDGRDCTKANNKRISPNNPLHTLWRHRWYELIHLFWENDIHKHKPSLAQKYTPITLAKATARPNNLQSQFAHHETVAHQLLADWRDVARDFPASLYAYATPSPRALELIQQEVVGEKEQEVVVEVGAGTGYWAALLQRQGVHIVPCDRTPPGTYSANEYHSEVPAFTHVHQADAVTSSSNSHIAENASVLFLCYPTPGTDMAVSAVRAFRHGNTVIHVGEWKGLTGDTAFEELLLEQFTLQTYLELPTWGTDAAYLTIWKRGKRASEEPNYHFTVATGGCLQCPNQATRRCRLARTIQYCTLDCFRADTNARKSRLLLQMIDTTSASNSSCSGGENDDVDWNNPRHFLELKSSHHEMRKRGHGRGMKKKRKKHKRR
jgi:hypothetical protein